MNDDELSHVEVRFLSDVAVRYELSATSTRMMSNGPVKYAGVEATLTTVAM